jgi:hypothetical protein
MVNAVRMKRHRQNVSLADNGTHLVRLRRVEEVRLRMVLSRLPSYCRLVRSDHGIDSHRDAPRERHLA